MPATLLDRAFELSQGELDTVQSWQGFHVIEVLEKASDRPLEEEELRWRQEAALQDWLAEARQGEGVQRFWSSDKVPPR